jgi:elongation factor P hydroxylase
VVCREKFERVKVGTRALERKLARSAGSLSDNLGVDSTFAAEVFRQVIHRLILVMIEAGLLSLIRQLTPAPPTAQIYPLPVPKPVA